MIVLSYIMFIKSYFRLRWLFGVTGYIMTSGVTFVNAQGAVPEPTITIKFRVIAWQSGSPSNFSYQNNGKSILVKDVYADTRSAAYDYTGPATLNLYPIAPPNTGKPSATLAEPPKPIASILIPVAIRSPLFVLMPNPGGPEAYRAEVFDDSPEVFPFPSYFLVNYSQQRIAAAIGQSRVFIEPEQSHLVLSKDKTLNLKLGVSVEKNRGWKLVYDDYFPNWSDLRTVIFIVNDTTGTRPRLVIRTLLENRAVWDSDQNVGGKQAH